MIFNGTRFIDQDASLFCLQIHKPSHEITRTVIWDGIQEPALLANAFLGSEGGERGKRASLTAWLSRMVLIFENMSTQEIKSHGGELFSLRSGYYLRFTEILPDSDCD